MKAKKFSDLKPQDTLLCFSDSTEYIVLDTAVVVYNPRDHKLLTITEKQMAKLGLSIN